MFAGGYYVLGREGESPCGARHERVLTAGPLTAEPICEGSAQAGWVSRDGLSWERAGVPGADGLHASAGEPTAGGDGLLASVSTLDGAAWVPSLWTSADGIRWRQLVSEPPGVGPGTMLDDRLVAIDTSNPEMRPRSWLGTPVLP